MPPVTAFLRRIEARPYYAWRGLLTVFFVAAGRVAQDQLLGYTTLGLETLISYAAWYAFLYWGTCAILTWALALNDWRLATQPAAYGLLFGLLPPLLDSLFYGPGQFRYGFIFQFAPWFVAPRFPLGETLVIWAAILAVGGYVALRGSRWPAVVLAALAMYLLLQLAGSWLPQAYVALFMPDRQLSAAKSLATINACVFALGSSLIYGWLNRRRLAPSLRRWPHALPWFFACWLGAELAGATTPATWLTAALVFYTHWLAVAVNDYYDHEADRLGRRASDIDGDDLIWLQALALWPAAAVVSEDGLLGTLLVLYTVGATAYHHHSLRLKQVCAINYKTEGFVGAVAFLLGAVAAGSRQLDMVGLAVVFLVYGGFAIVSAFKDYKDIDSDRAAGVKTIYVVLLARGWSLPRVHRLVRYAVASALLLGVALLGLVGAPWPALVGALMAALASYTILGLSKPERAVRAALFLVSAYLACLVAAARPLDLF